MTIVGLFDGGINRPEELAGVNIPTRGDASEQWLFEERGGARKWPDTSPDALTRSVRDAKFPEVPRLQDRQPAGSDEVVRRAAAQCGKRMCARRVVGRLEEEASASTSALC